MKVQTLLTKKDGFVAPTELLQIILARKPNAFGFAVQDKTGESPELSIVREKGTPSLAQVQEFFGNAKDFPALVYFGELGDDHPTDDIQPFILRDGDDNPFLAIGFEGDVSKFADPASGHTEEYNFATKIIIPSLLEICEYADGDLEKILAKVNAPLFNDNLLAHLGHRGSLTIMPVDGDPVWLGKNELGEAYDWGQVSNRHGYGDAKQEPAPVAAAPKKNRFSFGSKKEAPVQDAATPGTAERTSVLPAGVTAGHGTTADPVKGSKERAPERPPSWVHKNSDLDMWYQVVAGHIPAQKKKRIPIIPTTDRLPKDRADLLHLRAEQMKIGKTGTAVDNTAKIEAPKTETSAGAPKSGAEIAARRAEENSPIINAKDMEKLLDLVAKTFDSNSNEVMPIAELQALEKKLGDFSASVGVTPFEMLNWNVAGLFAIARTDYRAMVLAFIEMRKLWRNTLKAEDLVGTSKPAVTTTTTKIGDNSTKTESIVHEAPPAAAKKKGFSFGGKKVA